MLISQDHTLELLFRPQTFLIKSHPYIAFYPYPQIFPNIYCNFNEKYYDLLNDLNEVLHVAVIRYIV